ncbi:hypothetical protein DSO57_1010866 [Entomophthora muscae]|uniref:Uncharacterized protein n=1 Tax=Entomophthora muscae TaxID=34485 RepID=A0ACC2TUA6_9FUNG|nr:hypothetical protein DSO57_1010866 [Entomophthora muscae]
MNSGPYTAWQGCLIHTISFTEFQIFNNGLLIVDASGVITEFRELESSVQMEELKRQYSLQEDQVNRLTETQFLIPGFIDGHTHAPQYPNLGIGLDLPLMDWLEKYTFPTESKMKDTNVATQTYTRFVDSLIKNGTTTACYFATMHLEATKVLAEIVSSRGQRAWIGKVNMDCNSPDFLRETLEGSLESTIEFIDFMKQERFTEAGLIEPAITPRFVPTCSERLLKGLGEIASKHKLPIQSHLCENRQEIAFVKELFPNADNYTGVYQQSGLLSRRTIMAHCVYLTPDEIQKMAASGAAVAHCASSNFNLSSGVLDIKPLINSGIRVCLGTDVSGGTSPSMLHAIRSALIAAQTTQINANADVCNLDIMGAFFLATLGGAQAMALDDKIGNFAPKKHFDALVVDATEHADLLDLTAKDATKVDSALALFKKFVMTGDDRNIVNVFVKGRKIR